MGHLLKPFSVKLDSQVAPLLTFPQRCSFRFCARSIFPLETRIVIQEFRIIVSSTRGRAVSSETCLDISLAIASSSSFLLSWDPIQSFPAWTCKLLLEMFMSPNSNSTRTLVPRRLNRVAIILGLLVGVLLADRLMWFQYSDEAGEASRQTDVAQSASIRASLRRMSHAVLLLGNEDGHGAAVLPGERQAAAETTAETAGSLQLRDANEEGGSEDEDGSIAKFVVLLANMFNIFVCCVIAIGYPIAILPYYRSARTTEYVFDFWI